MSLTAIIEEQIKKHADIPEVQQAIQAIINGLDMNQAGTMCKEHGFTPYNEIDPCDIPF